MSRVIPRLILPLAVLALIPVSAAAQAADGGTVIPVLRMSVHTSSPVDGQSGEQFELELPPEIPIDRPFELRTWLPAEVEAASATYWRAGGECKEAADAGESQLPLKTVIRTVAKPADATDAGFVQHGKELSVSVPVLSEPWWLYCFAVELWLRGDGGPITGARLTVLLREISQATDEKGEVGPDAMRNAAAVAGIAQDCSRYTDWSKRYACEGATQSVAEDLLGNVPLTNLAGTAKSLRRQVDELRKHAAVLGDSSLVIPHYEELLALYGHEPTTPMEVESQEPAEARAEAAFRSNLLARDVAVLEDIADTLGATLPARNLKQNLGQSSSFNITDRTTARDAARALSKVEREVKEQSLSLRNAWFKEIQKRVDRHMLLLKQKIQEQEFTLKTLETQIAEALQKQKPIEDDLANTRRARTQAIGPIMDRLGKIQERESRYEKARLELAEAKQQNPPDPAQIDKLQKALDAARVELANAQPDKVKAEYKRVANMYDDLEKWFVERSLDANKAHGELLARKAAAEATRDAAQKELAACALVLSDARYVESTALDYENAFATTASLLRASTLSVIRPQNGTRARPAATHVERARGFFSTDVGLAVVAPPFGDPHPMAFVQMSVSLGQVSWDHGIGAVEIPKGTTTSRKLGWSLGQRLAFNVGLSMNLRPIRTPNGQLQGLFGRSSPMGLLGVGFRFSEFLKLNAGTAFGTTQPELPGVGSRLYVLPYVGVSLDLPVYRAVGKVLSPAFGPQFTTLEPTLPQQ